MVYQDHIFNHLKNYGFTKIDAAYLVHNYGKQTELIVENFKTKTHPNQVVNLALAELDFCIFHEMVVKPLDYFIRRTGRLYFDIQNIEAIKMPILESFSRYFNWDDATFKTELELINTSLYKASHFDIF